MPCQCSTPTSLLMILNVCGRYMMKNFMSISPTTYFVGTLSLIMDTIVDYWRILQVVLECTRYNNTID